MVTNVKRQQTIIPFLPGYMFNGYTLESTGAAIAPTQHINKETGELMYYVRPVFKYGGTFVGLYVRHNGIVDWVKGT